jgi:SH3-like domain-containing protein
MPTVREQILEVAARRKGMRYRLPPEPPDGSVNLDCSLFVVLTFRDAGLGFAPHVRTAEQIRQFCHRIDRSEMQPGDLLFFEKTFESGQRPGPDGKLATHVGIALNAAGTQMWDCHASNDNTDLPGVGITNINRFFWEPLLFEVRRAPALVGADDGDTMERIPLGDLTGPRFRVTTSGLRLRAEPSTSADILISDLGDGNIVTAVDDQIVERDEIRWRRVRAANGTVGWAAASFLEQIGGEPVAPPPPPPPPPPPAGLRFRITADALNLREQPDLQSATLTALGNGSIVTALEDATVEADEIVWRHVRTEEGAVGWMSSRFLEPVAT